MQGDIFFKSPRTVKQFFEMNPRCSQCGASFTPEPGFYFGAMYVSYIFSVVIFASVYVALSVLFDPPDWVYVASIIVSSVIFIPLSFKYSRVIWLYYFGGL
ncbi:MAG: DUF983 domain-containing protein [Candidatus Nephrothrix sp. EaCA]|nr:MAG: DUF983 domain-containing protein [Candidatus Nephrothrix sp. EaCA]